MQVLKLSALLAAFALAGMACHKRSPALAPATSPAPAPPTASARPPAPAPPPRAVAQPAASPLSEEELFRRKSLAQLNAEQPLGDAFFDYDQSTLRDDMRNALQADAAWLSRWPQTQIKIEGYCDERGTAEYNLALGDKRASAVTQYLESLGVSRARMTTVSLGKEARFCQESTEQCWSKNRRGHFVITAK